MGKYRGVENRQPLRPRPWDVHPVWRGIGCLLMILIPVLSYAGAVLLIEENLRRGWLPLPPGLARPVALPGFEAVPNLPAVLIVTVLLMLLGFGLVTILYSLLYSLVGPPRYSPLDSPEKRRRPRVRRD